MLRKRFLIWDNPKDAMVAFVLFLMGLGAINVFSASFVMAAASGSPYHYLFRYLIFAVIGVAVMIFLGRKDYHIWLKHDHLIYGFCLVMLLAVEVLGRSVKGAQRWIIIGHFSFQPSEIVKLAIILVGAAWLGKMMDKGVRPQLFSHTMPPILFMTRKAVPMIATLIPAALVFHQPDMGTAAIILALILIMYYLAGLEKWEIGLIFLLLAAAVVMAVKMFPYRLNRIYVWLDPWKDAQNYGYQAVQSFVTIGSGGLIGDPVGMGSGKFFYLPEAHTDFAFAIFCQEMGFIGAVALILLFSLLSLAIFNIGRNTQDRSGFLLVTGVNFLVVGQAFANMAMVTGILPVIGVPLSFISYGGTSLIVSLAAIGLAISVYRDEVRREEAEIPKKPPVPVYHDSHYVGHRRPGGRWSR
ncbi:MAG: rod shape-determining protein RodA [Acidaminococcus sp.]|jgi:cell division protein FtsW|nr:rod shape-determining protein RodA [Acidaminococcus sp.]MCI2100509.1 rod shape-determining protein RodA [Acidaminococcus sp.]MCI2114830.1 rod shape-determining protein RodA [Acidaminococcus sp.]MCI2116883.1 rod shape-determining protein RodA [Acidaminococcus sp.]